MDTHWLKKNFQDALGSLTGLQAPRSAEGALGKAPMLCGAVRYVGEKNHLCFIKWSENPVGGCPRRCD